VAYIKGILTYLLVASADATTNTAAKDVVGNKTDVAVSVVAATKSVIGYLKGIIALLQMLNRQKGSVWFADSTISASGAGQSWATAFKTITEAVAAAAAGDTIMIRGSFTEAVTCELAGLKFIGAGTNPNEAVWTAANDADCLTISAESVLVKNIKFRPPAYTADRTCAGIHLSTTSNYSRIEECRFQGRAGSQNAIYAEPCSNILVKDNEFIYMNTLTYGCAIKGVATTGLAFSAWRIFNNTFNSCLIGINIDARNCEVVGNRVAEYGIPAAGGLGSVLTLGIDLSGTDTGANIVTGNQLGGTYSATLYKTGTTGDQWAGNFNVLSGGITADNPA
jgi:hypothetical protein